MSRFPRIARWIAAVRRFFQKRPEPTPPMLMLPAPRRKRELVLPPVIHLGESVIITEDEKILWMHRKHKGDLASFDGRFYFKDDVLDQLDYYFQTIRRFKAAREDFYNLVSQTGVNLIPDRAIYTPPKGEEESHVFEDVYKAEPWFTETRPAFGAYCFGTAKKLRDIEAGELGAYHSRFVYFTRYVKKGVPITVQPVKEGTVYIMGTYFDVTGLKDSKGRPYKRKLGIMEAPVLLAHDGTITALKTLTSNPLRFPRKKRRRDDGSLAHRSEWGFAQEWIDWAKDQKTTPEKFICNLFARAVRLHGDLNSSMIRVHIKKHDLAAIMNVDMERTPYFFKDRQPVFVDGIKKKIFHIVRPHERISGNVSTDVHMHFRGLRKFSWNGYDVAITVPGWDHNNWALASFGAYDEESKKGRQEKNPVFMKELGERAAKAMTVPHLGARPR